MDASGMHYPHLAYTHSDGEIPCWPHSLCVTKYKVSTYPVLVLMHTMMIFGLSLGRTVRAYYTLWNRVSTLGDWSPFDQ